MRKFISDWRKTHSEVHANDPPVVRRLRRQRRRKPKAATGGLSWSLTGGSPRFILSNYTSIGATI